MKFENGISIIIPTYNGEEYISKLLDSLVNQTIDFNLFEAIFIMNGERDNTTEIIERYMKDNPKVNIILSESEKGVCNARNKGIKLAKREYTIFIDDDDYISHNYLEELYKASAPNRIVLGSFFDVDKETEEIKESYLSSPLLKYSGIIENPYTTEMAGALFITTNKLIPTINVKNSSFNPELQNGVDISYYSTFYAENDFEFFIVDKKKEAIYYRLWRDNSISRQKLSYEFNITHRLKVINDINKGLKKAKSPEIYNFIKSLTVGQVVLINKYLNENPSDYEKVLKDINSYNFEFFPYKYLNEDVKELDNEEKELIISYAFSPTNTTTSNVVAKRILTEKKNVDVVCASLDDLDKDMLLESIIKEYIVNKYVIESSFSIEWDNVKNFVEKGLEILPKYDKIYSRAFFSHSHFLALEYKLKYPDTYWRAEFSDPLVKPLGRRTSSAINDEEYVNRINSILKEKNLELININQDVNLICEYLTFIFADEIIFTNENQREVMINGLPYDIKINKETISPQPILDEKYYYITNFDYEVDENYLNFSYFGNIFSKRSFEDFISAFKNVKNKEKLRIHIFSKNKTLFEQVLPKEVYDITILNQDINYFEFLNLTKKFDVLLIEDSYTKGDEIINPYLPSKLSDYKGSKTPIWGVCEDSSPMDKLDLDYKSKLGNYQSNIQALNQIIKEKLNLEINSDIDESEYQRIRINELTEKISELIEVANNEFRKDEMYEAQINELNQVIQNLEQENSQIKNSNSWKMTKNLRKIGKKFK
ncbi:MAG: glycosyltransferase [Methanobrevibacter sp.]|nr:glycosyltransferase [Methanobrevibacter sp.]